MVMDMTREEVDKIINELFDIVEEFDARNISCNSVFEKFHGTGWIELCDKGIKLFEQLK